MDSTLLPSVQHLQLQFACFVVAAAPSYLQSNGVTQNKAACYADVLPQVTQVGYQPYQLALLEQGWVVALPHVRGGGELGRR
jgi:hypothetical protein